MSVWDWVLVVHLVAMAFFVGGQLMLAAVVVPVARRSGDAEALRAMARRFGGGTLLALVVLAASGSAMAAHYHRWSSTELQVKLGLVGVVALLVLWHLRRPSSHAAEGLIFVASLAIVALGVAIAH